MRKINVRVSSGLGDRLLTLLFYYVNFGSENEINIFWEKNNCLNCDYDKLFKNKVKLSFIKDNSFSLPPDVPVISRKNLVINYLKSFKNQNVLIKGEVFDKTSDFKKLDYKKYFRDILRPSDDIQSVVNEYIENNFNSKIIGVHFRAADKLCPKTLSFFSPKKSLFQILKEYDLAINTFLDDDCKIFLATDDSGPRSPCSSDIQNLKLKDYFKEKYGNKIIEFPCRSLARNTEEGIIDAFKTLILLSKCDCFVGSCRSSFSKLICVNFDDSFKLI